jgi:hypothetical protein
MSMRIVKRPMESSGLSTREPSQHVPPAKSETAHSREGDVYAPHVGFHGIRLLHDVDPDYHQRKIREKERDGRDTTRLKIEQVALVVGVVGIIGLLFTLCETIKATKAATNAALSTKLAADAAVAQSQAAVDALYSQRPVVSLGNRENIVAQYFAPRMGGENGALILYFQNTGPMSALDFLVNAKVGLFSNMVWCLGIAGRHIERIDKTYKPRGEKRFPGNTIGAESVYETPVAKVCVPTPDEWQKIQAGISDYKMGGDLEYCDWWGQYQCENFTIQYNAPAGRFFGEMQPCRFGYPPPPLEGRKRERDDGPRTLERCEQPEEHKQTKIEQYTGKK